MEHGTRPCWKRPALAGLALLLGLAPITGAAAQDAGPTTATTVEAWYQPPVVGGPDDPACGLLGCPTSVPVPSNPYPEQTLHVGAAQGRPESTTYVVFDALSGIPDGMELAGGTAIFPVAGTEDGTTAPELAELLACLTTTPFEPVEAGNTAEAPATDCNINAPAVYVGDAEIPHFEVDLAPFVEQWQRRDLAALALIPLPGGTTTWHAAFSGRDRDVEGAAPPITAALDLRAATVAPPPPTPSPTPTPAPTASEAPAASPSPTPAPSAAPAPVQPAPRPFTPSFTSPGLSTSQGTVTTPVEPPVVAADEPVAAAPEPTATTSAPAVVAQAPIAAVPRPYPYKVVFLLPLLLLLGAAGMGRTLENEVRVRATAA